MKLDVSNKSLNCSFHEHNLSSPFWILFDICFTNIFFRASELALRNSIMLGFSPYILLKGTKQVLLTIPKNNPINNRRNGNIKGFSLIGCKLTLFERNSSKYDTNKLNKIYWLLSMSTVSSKQLNLIPLLYESKNSPNIRHSISFCFFTFHRSHYLAGT